MERLLLTFIVGAIVLLVGRELRWLALHDGRRRAQAFVGGEVGLLFTYKSNMMGRPMEINYAGSRRSGSYRVFALANELVNYDSASWDWRGGQSVCGSPKRRRRV
jgi:hypothetical protein